MVSTRRCVSLQVSKHLLQGQEMPIHWAKLAVSLQISLSSHPSSRNVGDTDQSAGRSTNTPRALKKTGDRLNSRIGRTSEKKETCLGRKACTLVQFETDVLVIEARLALWLAIITVTAGLVCGVLEETCERLQ